MNNHIFTSPHYSISRSIVGPMMYPTNDMYVGRSINQMGEYAWDELVLMQKILLASKQIQPDRPLGFVEGGANIGFFAVGLARSISELGVYGIEPQPLMFNAFAANIAMNGLINRVFAERAALGSSLGKVNIPLVNADTVNNYSAFSLLNTTKHGLETPIITIDSLKVTPTLIKLDIEGYELEALRGAIDTLEESKPVLYLENNQRGKQGSLIRWLDSIGYESYWHSPLMWRPDNHFAFPESPWGGNPAAQNMLCVRRNTGMYYWIDKNKKSLLGPSGKHAMAGKAGEDVYSEDFDSGPNSHRFVPPTAEIPAHGIYMAE